jgi:branched-chain amino acid aminotransferase
MTADQLIKKKNVYEVVLITPDGFLLEGSRSNIFGIRRGILFTPKQKFVLPGITRQIVIELANENDIPVREVPIHKEELYDFQSFFITGTSPGILSVNKIDSLIFNCFSAPCEMLRKSFDNRVKQSIMQSAKKYGPQ